MSSLSWVKDLSTAPRTPPTGSVLIAILPDHEFPEALAWSEYDKGGKDATGEVGFWEYKEELINDVTGGVDPKYYADALWTHLEIPTND
jgi:hypothetical protein